MTDYFSGLGGFNTANGGAYYRGPVGQLLGSASGFSVSAMLAVNYAQGQDDAGVIFACGDFDNTNGWALFLESASGGSLTLGAQIITSVSGGVSARAPIAFGTRPFHIITMVVDPTAGADGVLRIHVDGQLFAETAWVNGDAYVPAPATARAGVGVALPAVDNPLANAFLMGLGYDATNDFLLSPDVIAVYQASALQAGDIVDGAQTIITGDSAFPRFDNLWSVRRGASGRGEPLNSIPGFDGPVTSATPNNPWVDNNGFGPSGKVDLEKVISAPAQPLISLGMKRIG